jgi:hypothetical protein
MRSAYDDDSAFVQRYTERQRSFSVFGELFEKQDVLFIPEQALFFDRNSRGADWS